MWIRDGLEEQRCQAKHEYEHPDCSGKQEFLAKQEIHSVPRKDLEQVPHAEPDPRESSP